MTLTRTWGVKESKKGGRGRGEEMKRGEIRGKVRGGNWKNGRRKKEDIWRSKRIEGGAKSDGDAD